MRQVVGIDRRIKRAWLDAALDRLVQTSDGAELRAFLEERLQEELPGKASRANTIGIILQIWINVPHGRLALRNRALALLPRISGQERVWLHWGMTALAYPFFHDGTEVIGRLLALQDDFTTAQAQARMLTTWGDRATSKQAAQKLITTLVDWEVLRATQAKGRFLLERKMTASVPALQLWLLEALLAASTADEIEAQQLLRLPELFPFTIGVGTGDLRNYEAFDLHRQGLDMDMVALRKVKAVEPSKKKAKTKNPRAAELAQPGLFKKQSELAMIKNAGGDGKPLASEPPFAAAFAECRRQLVDGHYLSCIALAQAIAEAVVLHLARVRLKKKARHAGTFKTDLAALRAEKFISDDLSTRIEQVESARSSFLDGLRSSAGPAPRVLKTEAREHVELVDDLERDLLRNLVHQSGSRSSLQTPTAAGASGTQANE